MILKCEDFLFYFYSEIILKWWKNFLFFKGLYWNIRKFLLSGLKSAIFSELASSLLKFFNLSAIKPYFRKYKSSIFLKYDLEGYKYLGMLQLDSIMKIEMKDKVKSEYIRRVKKFLRSKLNGRNVTAGMNAWKISIIKYGAWVLDWAKEKLELTLMTMNESLHPRRNVSRLYIAKKEGRRLIRYKECVNVEVQS